MLCTFCECKCVSPNELAKGKSFLSVYVSIQKLLHISLLQWFAMEHTPFLWGGDLDPLLISGSLGPPEFTTQTPYRSVQPFLQGSRLCPTDRETHTETTLHLQQYATSLHSVHVMLPNNSTTGMLLWWPQVPVKPSLGSRYQRPFSLFKTNLQAMSLLKNLMTQAN